MIENGFGTTLLSTDIGHRQKCDKRVACGTPIHKQVTCGDKRLQAICLQATCKRFLLSPTSKQTNDFDYYKSKQERLLGSLYG